MIFSTRAIIRKGAIIGRGYVLDCRRAAGDAWNERTGICDIPGIAVAEIRARYALPGGGVGAQRAVAPRRESKTRAPIPQCRWRGPLVGSRTCRSCGGSVSIKLYACSQRGPISIAQCRTCTVPDKEQTRHEG